MRFLFCCESYYPDRGGVQEVMRQLAERMVKMGHDVTVATSRNADRPCDILNGVRIREFNVAGKLAYKIVGDVDQYRDFVVQSEVHAILIMAAQQWSFDALWPILDRITARKVFIPCGFSCLYEPAFSEYFKQLPAILRKFDHLVFNAEHHRDIDFVRALGIKNFSVVPNGVSELDFETDSDPGFRHRLGVSKDDFVFLTVGNPINMKGHREVAEAFARLNTMGSRATLLMVARWPKSEEAQTSTAGAKRSPRVDPSMLRLREQGSREFMRRALRSTGWCHNSWKRLIWQKLRPALRLAGQSVQVVHAEGWGGFRARVKATLERRRNAIEIDYWVKQANLQPGKRVLCTDLARSDLVQAYMAADLFVFASVVEYSPLVLFEAGAAGSPFLSVPVGNAEEIAAWTGGGIICQASKDDKGYTRVDPKVLAREMERCMRNPSMLIELGAAGKRSWREQFTWRAVAPRYEALLSGRTAHVLPQKCAGSHREGFQAQ
jgi:glycosyltransferase involved in cell wall biosynthesis